MGKVDELIASWDAVQAEDHSPHRARTRELVRAKLADEADHAAEIAERNGRINGQAARVAEQQAELEAKDKRIRELEADLAKRELPPLPESVREFVDGYLRCLSHGLAPWSRDLIAWFDTHYPKPVPQWELDARYLESAAEALRYSAPKDVFSEHAAIAARIREAHREAK